MTVEYYQQEINEHEHNRFKNRLYGFYDIAVLFGMLKQEQDLYPDEYYRISEQIINIMNRYYRELKTKLESIERKDQNDDSINHEYESAGHRADGHTKSQTSDNADQVCCEQETGKDRSDGERG